MKLLISLSGPKAYRLENAHGLLSANWKTDLADEESDAYLPKGYSYNKVLELELIRASAIGKGHGDALMREFLASPVAAKAELIMLDPVPNVFDESEVPEQTQIKKLHAFYAKHGFRHSPRSNRMWLVRKGHIDTHNLPT